MLPARKPKKLKLSQVDGGPKRVWQKHRRFVRKHECVVSLTTFGECEGPVEFAHYRTAANSGTSLKPHDWFGVSMCHKHHAEQHQIGQRSFEKKYGIDFTNLSAEFANKSDDAEMKAAMRGQDYEPSEHDE